MQIGNTLARPKFKPDAGGRAAALETESATVVALSPLPTRTSRSLPVGGIDSDAHQDDQLCRVVSVRAGGSSSPLRLILLPSIEHLFCLRDAMHFALRSVSSWCELPKCLP